MKEPQIRIDEHERESDVAIRLSGKFSMFLVCSERVSTKALDVFKFVSQIRQP